MNKWDFISILLLTFIFLYGAFAFVYGCPSFMERTYQYKKNGVIYEVHEFPWINDSLYNYAIGFFCMFTSAIFIIMLWQAKHDSYDSIIY